MDINRDFLLSLIKKTLWNIDLESIPEDIEWSSVAHMASVHSVIPFAYVGVTDIKNVVPRELLQRWKSTTIAGIMQNDYLLGVQDSIISQLNNACIPVCVLKGSSIARLYPTPDYRIMGDIDLLIPRDHFAKAGAVIGELGFVKCEEDTGFHVAYRNSQSVVELHYELSEYPDSAGGQIAKEISEGCWDGIETVSLRGSDFPVLSDLYQTLSLLLHMERHMVKNGIGLRQLCDWAVYISGIKSDIFTESLLPILNKCGLSYFAKVATRACVLYLGLESSVVSWCSDIHDHVCDAFIEDVFRGGNMGRSESDGGTDFLTDSRSLGAKDNNVVKTVFGSLNQRAYQYYPVSEKYKMLLPLFWVYIPLRYIIRRKRDGKRSLAGLLKASRNRAQLYRELKLFDVD